MERELKSGGRISSIDILRGLVMMIMLVDHTRERFFLHQQVLDPMDVESTDPGLFFTRLSAHLCAPVFVFLTGLSAWLYAHPLNKEPRSASSFLLKRGLFLILVEVTVVNFSWFGAYHTVYLQVIWAIGLSMIALSILSKLPRWCIGLLGFIIVFGHNALTHINFQPEESGYFLWTILHDRGYLIADGAVNVKVSYPVLPWIGVIALGYFAGPLFNAALKPKKRHQYLIMIGTLLFALLFILRGFNLYGETEDWVIHERFMFTVMDFLNYTKYPPSLDFILLTLGIGMFLLLGFEKMHSSSKWSKILRTYGSAPMFFYIIHLYVLLIIYQICVAVFGINHGSYFGVDHVWQVWVISFILFALLYYPTKKFAQFKKRSSSQLLKYF
ncbi:heparan-alpha-glucosaminide N-acetyltransferase domain-containing protein [Fulvivirga maritima]|uniref:DUF1624 domain-containing protein n=1 Tax=Fulvivirga maritima TaxID=2904247 RepID=UPI001F38BB5C|nr:heparan-alpha-glucosaminide N-acetyltransferase domain-containing protein [Fulvivirga maritima]UII25871.1 heparan-alpha-glucosaminide N-acetyltransferase domain-containing protein [Fulvivirga maritima]